MGPAATLKLPPRVTLPPLEKASTAAGVLRTITHSVICTPARKPTPRPPVPIAEGPLQPPPGRRAITTPLPARPLPMNPAFVTVRIARPRAFLRTDDGIPCSGIA